MTNYNERLDEILYDLDLRVDSGQAYIFDTAEARQAIASLINQQVVQALQQARIKIVELDQMYEPNTVFDPAVSILDEAIKEYKGE